MNETPRTLATVRRYKDLMAVLRARVDELEITRETIDTEGNLPPRYSQKLLSPVPIKRVSASLDALLGVLKLELIVVEACSERVLPKRRVRLPVRM